MTPLRQESLPSAVRLSPVEKIGIGCVLLYVFFSIFGIVRLPPINDEAVYAAPAVSLVREGNFASSVVESRGSPLEGVDKVTYYALPGLPLTNAAVVLVFGNSLTALRFKSFALMLASAALLFRSLRRLGLSRPDTTLALGLVCLDRNWLQASVVARPDAQCFFLGLSGVFLVATSLERRRFLRLAVGIALITAAGLTHVNGAIFGLFAIVCLAHHGLRNPQVLRSTFPLAAVLGALPLIGAYIAFARLYPGFYRGQMGWNATVWNRLDAWAHPLSAVAKELARWVPHPNSSSLGSSLLYATASLMGLVGLVVVLRWAPRPFRMTFAAYLVCTILSFCFLNNIDSAFYFFYRSFLMNIAVVGAWSIARDSGGRWRRAGMTAASILLALFSLSKDAVFVAKTKAEAAAFQSFTDALVRESRSDDAVVAPLEFAFSLSFSPALKMDDHYGFFSGRAPTLVVLVHGVGGKSRSLQEAVSGGICSPDPHVFADYSRFNGPAVSRLVIENRSGICAYLESLMKRSRLLHRGADYDLLRIAAPTP